MIKNIILLASLVCISACATNTPVNISGKNTQLAARQIQTRQYDTLDKTLTMRSVVATLQDLGFTIDQADTGLGTITATRYDQQTTMRMTVTVVQRDKERMSVRANGRIGEDAVNNAETYQDFFVVLDKAMFLTSHQID